jgi:Methionine biosynthesis protein MetW
MQLIYKNTALYSLVNRALYGRHHATRYRVIADLIPAQSTVVDLCCGPATLYHRFLKEKSVHYTGLDISPFFIRALNERGGLGLLWDVRSGKALPDADYLVIQGSLYFFLPDPSSLIERMLAAATKQVIIAEPVRNLSTGRFQFISNIAMELGGAVRGNHPVRFTEQTLDKFFERYSSKLTRAFKIPGDRDKVYVLEKAGAGAVVH